MYISANFKSKLVGEYHLLYLRIKNGLELDDVKKSVFTRDLSPMNSQGWGGTYFEQGMKLEYCKSLVLDVFSSKMLRTLVHVTIKTMFSPQEYEGLTRNNAEKWLNRQQNCWNIVPQEQI